jgi:hypothetical protein
VQARLLALAWRLVHRSETLALVGNSDHLEQAQKRVAHRAFGLDPAGRGINEGNTRSTRRGSLGFDNEVEYVGDLVERNFESGLD